VAGQRAGGLDAGPRDQAHVCQAPPMSTMKGPPSGGGSPSDTWYRRGRCRSVTDSCGGVRPAMHDGVEPKRLDTTITWERLEWPRCVEVSSSNTTVCRIDALQSAGPEDDGSLAHRAAPPASEHAESSENQRHVLPRRRRER